MQHFTYFFLASLNCALCASSLINSIREKHLIALFWFLSTYISIMFMFTSFLGRQQELGFTNQIWNISDLNMNKAMLFVLASNLLFFLGTKLPTKKLKPSEIIKNQKFATNLIANSYFIVFLISFYFYFSKMQDLGYRGFVEYSGSDWSKVFLIVSSVAIILCYIRKKYLCLSICIILISYLSYLTDIRSFLIISFLPLIVYTWITSKDRRLNRKTIGHMFLVVFLLAVVSTSISFSKIGRIVLPESNLTNYYVLIYDRISYGSPTTGFNSLLGFAEGVMGPFLKLTGVSIFNAKDDTPTYLASLIFGTDNFGGVTYHFPSLWYSDSFVSFGFAGCLLGIFWGWLITYLDRIMRSNKDILLFFMPYYVWFVVFVFRGAIANSTIAISYSFYVQLIVFIFLVISYKTIFRTKV